MNECPHPYLTAIALANNGTTLVATCTECGANLSVGTFEALHHSSVLARDLRQAKIDLGFARDAIAQKQTLIHDIGMVLIKAIEGKGA